MFENILVPVDLTDKSLRAIHEAVEIARVDAARITLLHVIETIPGFEFDELADFYSELEAKAEAVMAEWCQKAETGNLRLDRIVVCGPRTGEILRLAHDLACDLILVPSHPTDVEHPSGSLGTISHQIALLASCSVMLLR